MKRKYRIVMLLFTAILFIFGVGITYSIFNSRGIMSSTDQSIAKFIFNAQGLDHLELPLVDLNPGDSEEYAFAVKNNNEEIISNVNIQYQMTVKTYHLVPLIIELYKINGETEELIMTCDESFSRNENNELICNAPIQEMAYSGVVLDNYKLKVHFPSEYNGIEYSNLVDYINVEIKSWQKMEN